MATLNIPLTPELEKLIDDRVKSGRYTSVSEVICEALLLMESRDRIAEGEFARLKADVDAGVRQLDEGRLMPFDTKAALSIKQAGRAELAARKGAED